MKKLPNRRQQQLTSLFAVLGVLTPLLFASRGLAADITTTNSGNWTSTTVNAPWPGGVVPASTDDVDVELPGVLTVDSTATIDFVYGAGTITMTPNSTLTIVGNNAGQGAQSLGLLNASAISNSVVYKGNAFFCKHQNYYNLTLSGFGTLYNGEIGIPGDGAVPMTIAGNMIVDGTANIQEASSITVNGNMTLGTNCQWDCSVSPVTILGNTTINGTMIDYAGGPNPDDSFNNITINPSGKWNLTDVIEWNVTGNLTNNGTILSGGAGGAGGITFTNMGIVIGNPFTVANLIVNGTTTVATTITATNFVGFGGTFVFDLATAQHQIVCGQPLTVGGNLTVINSGPAPISGTVYHLFNAPSFGGSFATESLPSLPAGLSWIDNVATAGTLTVTGTLIGPPVITSSVYNPATHQFTLTWNSTPGTNYSVQASTNLLTDPFSSHVLATGIPSGGAQTTKTVTVPTGSQTFLRISEP